MKKFFLLVANLVLTALLRIRYRITYKGLDKVLKTIKASKRGCLFLPTHLAVVVDPLIIGLPLVRHFPLRPLIVEYMYYAPLFHRLMRLFRALPICDFSTGYNPLKLKRTETMLHEVVEGLKKGERFLIYPSGTTRHTAREVVGGAFGVHQIVSTHPDVDIVLVRLTGLWGSTFSRALTLGKGPNAIKALTDGMWTALKNLLFFVPKREVTVEFELAAPDFPYHASKVVFNQYLETWYNKPYGPHGEPLKLVSFSFWKEDFPIVAREEERLSQLEFIPSYVRKAILAKLQELSNIPSDKISYNMRLVEDLGLDSLTLAELIFFLEEQFDVTFIVPEDLVTVAHVLEIAMIGKISHHERQWDLKDWNKARPQKRVQLPGGKTLPEVFLKACDGRLFDIATADPARGPITYYTIKRTCLLLSKQIAKLQGDKIGILIAAANPAQILVLSCQMAGKIPVMIDWTIQDDTCHELDVVLSSWVFLDRPMKVDLSHLKPKLVMLEELKIEATFFDVLRSAIAALMPSFALRKRLLPIHSDAVQLVQKGSISHTAVLSDMRQTLEANILFETDRLLAAAPSFTYSGFCYTGMLPLLSGLRVVYYPNPDESKRLAYALDHWNVTVLWGRSETIQKIFESTDAQHAHLRLVLTLL
ncbi:MAG: 1-acyl-sn-glycerol-3-phosphate acyltransferase [Verrucomicrobia bacterium]|nr:1-acyl-sn-glycerol-3-phosphate acyltransferase [Verrucomicrobiota bacterium]